MKKWLFTLVVFCSFLCMQASAQSDSSRMAELQADISKSNKKALKLQKKANKQRRKLDRREDKQKKHLKRMERKQRKLNRLQEDANSSFLRPSRMNRKVVAWC